jgi:hypothetical protein
MAERHPHLATPAELQERIRVERGGCPFVLYRDEAGGQRIAVLSAPAITIGRDGASDVALAWDRQVSTLHAELRQVGDHWVVVDDGLSRNGTFVNRERVSGRRRLRDGDQIELGRTTIIYRDPTRPSTQSTAAASTMPAPPLSPAQRRVLVALCRPYRDGSAFGRPASNQQIADELFLSVAGVKTHLRALFQRFAVEDLPHNEKRVRLVERAFATGVLSPAELEKE